MSNFEFLDQTIEKWKQSGTYRPLIDLESAQGAKVKIDGKEMIQLSSNNYLGLTTHPYCVQEAIKAIQQWGVGTGSVRTIAGTFSLHQEFEERLAEFKQTEATLVFQSGFTANVGVLSSILSEEDVVISDELNHASIIDGIRLTKAKRIIYDHSDMDDLERALKKSQSARVKLVVTDGVFSMDGDIARLPEIVELCERYQALVMVDDAHASGVLGRSGRGSVDHFDLHGKVQIQVGTLSKAFGVLGGYVAGSKVLCDYLVHQARPFLFSTSHPPAVVAACQAALHILQTESVWMEKLWRNTKMFQSGLVQLGFDIGHTQTPITPVMVRDDALAIRFSNQLQKEGVFAQGIIYPTVPKGKARIRTIVTALHKEEELEYCLEVFEKVGRQLSLI